MDASATEDAAILWRDGAPPLCLRFGDGYRGAADALGESRHVFLAGNDLPARFRSGFRIAELGFGTGLNALAAWAAWRDAGLPGDLAFTSFEGWPLPAAALARALGAAVAPEPQLAPLAEALVAAWATGARELRLPGLALRVIEGDARATVPAWDGAADAWFLDGFAPARNPQMWEPALLAAVARRTAPGGTAATYSAAGAVRAALAEAGFAVERVPGFGAKRHMTRARRAA
jgi:tRNA U34 5-methylaminomethyl-2-thiouridine-forming methyltransferase MnmC